MRGDGTDVVRSSLLPTSRERRPRLVAAWLGIVLLAAAAVLIVRDDQAAARGDLDRALQARADLSSKTLTDYFERARGIDLLLANDAAFRRFSPERRPTGSRLTRASAQASASLAYLERLYPGRIGEACLIGADGVEVARAVEGVVAPAEDLSHDEAAAPFFAPTVALPRGRVFQAAPYLSPDTGTWVISNSTPMLTSSGRPWGLVHYEVALDSFRPRVTQVGGASDVDVAVVELGTGQVVLHSGTQPAARSLGPAMDADLLALARSGRATATIDGRQVATVPVAQTRDNANRWVVVASAPAAATEVAGLLGPSAAVLGLAALLLLLIAGLDVRSHHRALRLASVTDELTRLANRRMLRSRLDEALVAVRRGGGRCAVLMVDLDGFKDVNDTLGHDRGDDVLRLVAARLTACFADRGTVARLGGDEFAVVLPEAGPVDDVVDVTRRFLALLAERVHTPGHVLEVGASIGIALAPEHGTDGADLMRAADAAMYRAKSQRLGVAVHDGSLPAADGRLSSLVDVGD